MYDVCTLIIWTRANCLRRRQSHHVFSERVSISIYPNPTPLGSSSPHRPIYKIFLELFELPKPLYFLATNPISSFEIFLLCSSVSPYGHSVLNVSTRHRAVVCQPSCHKLQCSANGCHIDIVPFQTPLAYPWHSTAVFPTLARIILKCHSICQST